ncbi:hypothetical protein SELMODRAFT_432044 [Selaginella moellendorffii]|uniref:Uncharacterized protein n=1 Tax=Selaginella moellendorffii TaxID=88036 RepID=D8TET2_SELML|nr:hypothetical protein SELMODRAFT_432044 [Selaginella moellendorffii]
MIYESRATVLMFKGNKLRVVNREDFPQEIVLDSKVDTISSIYEFNVRKAKWTTFTRYLPAWEKHEYDALVSSWRKRVTDYESGSEEAKEITQRVNAAEMAFEWFGGIPWFLWDVEANGLTVEAFERD